MKLDKKIKAYRSLDSGDVNLDPDGKDGEVCYIAKHENDRFYLGCPFDGYEDEIFVDLNTLIRALLPYLNLRGVVRLEKDGTYTAMCPEMPGCENTGKSADDALKALRESMYRWVVKNMTDSWDQRLASKDHHDAYRSYQEARERVQKVSVVEEPADSTDLLPVAGASVADQEQSG